MSPDDSSDRAAAPPGTARDGTRVEDAAPEAIRIPPRDTDPVDGPPDESGVSAREERGDDAPKSDVPTPRNVEPVISERSAPTIRRDRLSRPSRGRLAKLPPALAPTSDGSEDTLLSAPAPADHFEVDVERRLEETERRLDQVEADLARLAARPAAAERSLGHNPLFWVVFLLATAVAWLFFHGGVH